MQSYNCNYRFLRFILGFNKTDIHDYVRVISLHAKVNKNFTDLKFKIILLNACVV